MGVKPSTVDHKHDHQRADMGVMAEDIQTHVSNSALQKLRNLQHSLNF